VLHILSFLKELLKIAKKLKPEWITAIALIILSLTAVMQLGISVASLKYSERKVYEAQLERDKVIS